MAEFTEISWGVAGLRYRIYLDGRITYYSADYDKWKISHDFPSLNHIRDSKSTNDKKFMALYEKARYRHPAELF